MADLDTEQQNRIRIALGLKPLPGASGGPGPQFKEHSSSSESEEEASTLETRQAAGYENWKTLQDEADAKKLRADKKATIKRARESAQKHVRLEGQSLGDAGNAGDQDTRSWLQGSKKRQKKLDKERTRKLELELAEREKLANIEYTAKDLAGVKVGHEIGDFENGESEQILTLKDTTIDENEEEGDELENAELREREKLSNRLELKKRKPVYDPHANEENGESKILAHYDEEIEGKKRKQFVFDGQGSTIEERAAKRQEIGEKLKAQPLSFDFAKVIPESDYVEAKDVKLKKPKKAKKKAARQRELDEDVVLSKPDDAEDSMEVDGAAPNPKRKAGFTDLVDDEDLQASLAAQRRAAFKKRKRQRPEDIAREINDDATPGEMNVDDDEPGLVLDETSEFVANLRRPLDDEPEKRTTTSRPDPTSDSDTEMKAGTSPSSSRPTSPPPSNLTTTGLREEASMSTGLGAAFSLLKERGLIQSDPTSDINALHRDRQAFIASKQRLEASADLRARQQRERDRNSGKLEHLSAREREEHARWENRARDTQESRALAQVFDAGYKPDVQLKYVDEHGRQMGQKEAWKHLSHQFHGKGSGKGKMEKHLKKIGEEKRKEAKGLLDTGLGGEGKGGMAGVAVGTAKRKGTAGVRLG